MIRAKIGMSTSAAISALPTKKLTTIAPHAGVAARDRGGTSGWWTERLRRQKSTAATALPGLVPNDETLVPRRAETAITRARAFVSAGRLREALTELDLVRSTDAEKANADGLRTEIQRHLLGMVNVPHVPASPVLEDRPER